MARPKLLLHAVTRSVGEDNEELTFEPGVNLIVGERNSGKSKWLETIDQLLGDDIGAKERTTDDVLLKYDSAALSFSIGEERFAVERHWKQPGLFSKVSVNGNIQSLKDYRELLMQRLEIPIVHFPQGDPYGRRAWPELGWRSLIRHIYRRQKFWTELADRQPESEQHACLMQFLGVATTLFSPDYSALIEQEKTVTTLEAERDQFLRVLNEVTREVVHAKELGIAVNTESVTEALERLEAEQTRIQGAREDVLQRLGRQASPGDDGVVSQLSAALIAVRSEQEITAEALQRTQARMEELGEYRRVLHDELSRMQRAVDAGSVLTDLKITHCPACDQPVDSNAPRPNECYLCKQSIATDVSSDTAGRRVQFEVEQLQAELSETDELLQVLEQDVHKHNAEERALKERQREIEGSLQPVRSVASAILPPELALYDMESGRLQEQVRQIQRVMTTLEHQDALTQRINALERSIAAKQGPVTERRNEIDFYKLGHLMAVGMNKYLRLINELRPGAYSQKPVHFTIWDRGFQVTVGEGRWDRKLGATLGLYFLLAYHYASSTHSKTRMPLSGPVDHRLPR